MSLGYQNIVTRERLRKKFIDPRGPINSVPKDKIVGSIYTITNTNDGKVYVGQTEDFNRRATEYIRFLSEDTSTSIPISRAYTVLRDNGGLENFVMRRLYDCTSYDELFEKEVEYIREYDAANPSHGYNINESNTPEIRRQQKFGKGIKHRYARSFGITASAVSKKKRSFPALCINPYVKRIFIAESMKLFADAILHTKKDCVSHAKTRADTIYDYYVYAFDGDGGFINAHDSDQYLKYHAPNDNVSVLYDKYYRYVQLRDISDYISDGYTVWFIQYVDSNPFYRILLLSDDDGTIIGNDVTDQFM